MLTPISGANLEFMSDEISWESGDTFVARQTKQIEREFKTSRPKPRNRRMGFRGEKPVFKNPDWIQIYSRRD